MFIFYISVFLFLTEISFDFVLQRNTRTFNFKAKIDNGKFHIIKLRFSHQNVLQRCSQDQNSHFSHDQNACFIGQLIKRQNIKQNT
jgi:hypothetical protein